VCGNRLRKMHVEGCKCKPDAVNQKCHNQLRAGTIMACAAYSASHEFYSPPLHQSGLASWHC
jgi:hypothetical protein